MHYYTYAYLREDRTPYYIGKGQGNRAYRRSKKRINPPKDKSRIIFLKQNLTEEEAFKHEIYMIAVFGRKDLGTGILHNRTNGGEGGSGRVLSEETRRKLSDANRGKNHPNYGKTTSLETKAKISASKKNMSDETRAKYSAANTGENHPFYGKTHSPETRAKYSAARKGENHPFYGKKWWNDGCGNCKIMIECPGDGWKPGKK
jgi:hypothetical protein